MNPTDPSIIHGVSRLQAWSDEQRRAGKRIALVPTMGALHEGHLSLVRLARARANRVIVSIFVNPTQFAPGEDFERYPRDLESDLAKLRPLQVDAVFAPSVGDLYPAGPPTWVEVDGLTESLCGRGRPGHFRGVTTVVARLFNAAKPDIAIFGEKDYQQLATIKRMVRDLCFDLEILSGATVREPDGLALSSRNAYLAGEGRRQARALSAALVEARNAFESGERGVSRLLQVARQRIEKEPLIQLEYLDLADAESLGPLLSGAGIQRSAVLAVAATIEGTRLIDNTVLEVV